MKESNKNLEDKVKELEEQLSKNKSKVKSQKVQLEQLRKSHKAKDMEEESAKSKTEVKNVKLFFSGGNLELPKRGKTQVPKSRVGSVLHLIGRTVAKVLMINYRAK